MTSIIGYLYDCWHSIVKSISNYLLPVWSPSSSQRTVVKTPSISVAVHVIVVRRGCLLLVQRREQPFQGYWTLPGGPIDPLLDADLLSAALRQLKDDTNIDCDRALTPYMTIGNNQRDPDGFTVATVFVLQLAEDDDQTSDAGHDVCAVKWCPLTQPLGNLAFDHTQIVDAFRTNQ